MGAIPPKEQPTEALLQGYRGSRKPLPDLAWGPYFMELNAWLTDYQVRKHEKALNDEGGPAGTEPGYNPKWSYQRPE